MKILNFEEYEHTPQDIEFLFALANNRPVELELSLGDAIILFMAASLSCQSGKMAQPQQVILDRHIQQFAAMIEQEYPSDHSLGFDNPEAYFQLAKDSMGGPLTPHFEKFVQQAICFLRHNQPGGKS